MDRWAGRMALVPDASEGVGMAIVEELVVKGMKVVAMAPSVEALQALRMQLRVRLPSGPGELYPIAGDAKEERNISAAFESATKLAGNVDVLISNVDSFTREPTLLSDGRISEDVWRTRFNKNMQIFKTSTCCLLKSMEKRRIDDGHIIYINRLEKHRKSKFPSEATYYASKYGITAIVKGLRSKFFSEKTRIRITVINIGDVQEKDVQRFNAGEGERLALNQEILHPTDVAASVLFALGAPAHVQVQELNVKSIWEE